MLYDREVEVFVKQEIARALHRVAQEAILSSNGVVNAATLTEVAVDFETEAAAG